MTTHDLMTNLNSIGRMHTILLQGKEQKSVDNALLHRNIHLEEDILNLQARFLYFTFIRK